MASCFHTGLQKKGMSSPGWSRDCSLGSAFRWLIHFWVSDIFMLRVDSKSIKRCIPCVGFTIVCHLQFLTSHNHPLVQRQAGWSLSLYRRAGLSSNGWILSLTDESVFTLFAIHCLSRSMGYDKKLHLRHSFLSARVQRSTALTDDDLPAIQTASCARLTAT